MELSTTATAYIERMKRLSIDLDYIRLQIEEIADDARTEWSNAEGDTFEERLFNDIYMDMERVAGDLEEYVSDLVYTDEQLEDIYNDE